MHARVSYIVGAIGLVGAIAGSPALASDTRLNGVTLAQYFPGAGNVIGVDEAHRLADRARRDGRWDDFRYWQAYATGLEGQRGPDWRRDDRPPAPYRAVNQYPGMIGPDQAYALEQQARDNGRWDEARYWADYRRGLR